MNHLLSKNLMVTTHPFNSKNTIITVHEKLKMYCTKYTRWCIINDTCTTYTWRHVHVHVHIHMYMYMYMYKYLRDFSH